MTVGEFLAHARLKANLSQWDVAKKLGYTSPQFVSNVERGISKPPIKVLKTLVEMYGIKPRDLIVTIEIQLAREMNARIREIREACLSVLTGARSPKERKWKNTF